MIWNMIWPIVFGQLRHLITAAGGAAVSAGYIGQDESTAIVGGAVALVGAVWSIVQKVTQKG